MAFPLRPGGGPGIRSRDGLEPRGTPASWPPRPGQTWACDSGFRPRCCLSCACSCTIHSIPARPLRTGLTTLLQRPEASWRPVSLLSQQSPGPRGLTRGAALPAGPWQLPRSQKAESNEGPSLRATCPGSALHLLHPHLLSSHLLRLRPGWVCICAIPSLKSTVTAGCSAVGSAPALSLLKA